MFALWRLGITITPLFISLLSSFEQQVNWRNLILLRGWAPVSMIASTSNVTGKFQTLRRHATWRSTSLASPLELSVVYKPLGLGMNLVSIFRTISWLTAPGRVLGAGLRVRPCWGKSLRCLAGVFTTCDCVWT